MNIRKGKSIFECWVTLKNPQYLNLKDYVRMTPSQYSVGLKITTECWTKRISQSLLPKLEYLCQ